MVGKCGDARFELLFGFDAVVRLTEVPDMLRRVQGVTPQKYLVIPGIDGKVFPLDFDLSSYGISYEPRTVVRPNLLGESNPNIERVEMKDCNPGDAYPITLVKPVLRVATELAKKGISMTDDVRGNVLVFSAGELEQRVAIPKGDFSVIIRKIFRSGTTIGDNINERIYYRFVVNTIHGAPYD